MAKCIRCGSRATHYVSYVRGGFCREHFLEYVEERVVRTVERYKMIPRGSRVVVAVSGGKDSIVLLHALAKHRDEIGYSELVAVHINLGIRGYSEEAERVSLENCEKLGVKCIVINLREVLGVGVEELSRKARRPACSVCGLVKRYVLNAVALALGADVLATGHHLDDILVYTFKNMLSASMEELAKLTPVSPGVKGLLVTRIRPLFEVYEENTLAYVTAAGLTYLATECPLKHLGVVERESREYLERLEKQIPGFKLTVARNMLKTIAREKAPESPGRCELCLMPSRDRICSFCRLTEKALGKPMGEHVVKTINDIVGKLAVGEVKIEKVQQTEVS